MIIMNFNIIVAYSKNRKWFPYPDKTARLQVVDNTNNKWFKNGVLDCTWEIKQAELRICV